MAVYMLIRKYIEGDFSCLASIYDASRPDEFYAEEGDFKFILWAEDEYIMSILGESEIYVYEEGTILGFCGFTKNHIHWLFVDPLNRGRGVGSKLLSYVLSKLKGRATLTVWKSNERAKTLYKKHGFHVSKEFSVSFQERDILVNTMVCI